jgi:hypothetical protein
LGRGELRRRKQGSDGEHGTSYFRFHLVFLLKSFQCMRSGRIYWTTTRGFVYAKSAGSLSINYYDRVLRAASRRSWAHNRIMRANRATPRQGGRPDQAVPTPPAAGRVDSCSRARFAIEIDAATQTIRDDVVDDMEAEASCVYR